MGLFLVYLFKSTICLIFFYCFNKLVLSRETFHTFNRMMWLCVMAISLILPFMEWDGFYLFSATAIPVSIVSTVNIPLNLYVDTLPTHTNDTIFWVVKCLFITYLVFAAILAVRLLLSYLGILFTVKTQKGRVVDVAYKTLLNQCKQAVGLKREIHLIVHDKKISPFSWMNNVVISKDDMNEDGKEILIHELSHVKYRHSWDILIVDLLIIFQWFNPIVWLYKQSLLQTHEYMADKSVLDTGVNSKLYQLLLIKKTADKCCCYSMTNSLNQSKLKNRIIMMLKEKSSKWAMAKCLYLLPLACISATLFAMPKVSDHLEEISTIELLNGSSAVNVSPEGIDFQKDSIRIDTSKVVVVGFGNTSNTSITIRGVDAKNKSLVILDGKETTKDISTLDANTIETVSVLKEESAIKIYGEKAKHGVIMITTKKNKSKDVNAVVIVANGSTDMEDISVLKEDARKNGDFNLSYRINEESLPFAMTTENGKLKCLTIVESKDNDQTKTATNFFDKYNQYLIVINDKVSTKSELAKLKAGSYYMYVLKREDGMKRYGYKAKNGVVMVKTMEKNK